MTAADRPLEAQQGEAFRRLVTIVRTLLSDQGCPWDRQQTYQSLRPHVLEEACEVLDAIDRDDKDALREELGDLLLQVVFQAELARRDRLFGPDDVINGICDKLQRRHPHVFGQAQPPDEAGENRAWERIKRQEKPGRALLDGVPLSLPALARAQRIGEKVERVGFDWPDVAGSRAKVAEEMNELDAAIASQDKQAIHEELGDTLFALVNLARHLGVQAESALRDTNRKFQQRFRHVERRVNENHGGFGLNPSSTLPLETMDAYWEEAKRKEKG